MRAFAYKARSNLVAFEKRKGVSLEKIVKNFSQVQGFAKLRIQRKILPFLTDTNRLNAFLDKLDADRLGLTSLTGLELEELEEHIGELYLHYLEETHPEQLEISVALCDLTDMRRPHEWFPKARSLKRRIIYHYGPTNSGKTMSSLQRLLEAKKGIYCAPLKLLAKEVQSKLLKAGTVCSLLTGDERDPRPDATITSCTVEMANLEEEYDIAVIDEIQLIDDLVRGTGWTNCLLGLCAKELHLCGDARAAELVAKIVAETGDHLEFREYRRRNKLNVEKKPYNLDTDLQPGDCFISFEKRSCHAIKNVISALTEVYREHQGTRHLCDGLRQAAS